MNTLVLTGGVMWVLGLGTVTASLGWRLWQWRTHTPILDGSYTWAGLNAGVLLFYVGMALAASQPWARLLFAFLAAAWAVLAVIGQKAAPGDGLERGK